MPVENRLLTKVKATKMNAKGNKNKLQFINGSKNDTSNVKSWQRKKYGAQRQGKEENIEPLHILV